MKYNKKLLALIMAVISVCLMLCGTVLAQNNDLYAKSIEEEIYNKFVSFGIFSEDDSFRNNTVISRGDFVRLAVKFSGRNADELIGGKPVFLDIDANDKNYKYAMAAYNLGYISGAAEGVLNPDDPIIGSHALKIVVSILGYTPYAEILGGYPEGYINVAHDLGIMDTALYSTNEAITWNSAMKLFDDASKCRIMESEGVQQGNNMVYDNSSDENILSEKFYIYRARGIITKNKYTSINEIGDGTNNDTVVIDGKKYKTGDTDAETFIGQYVDIYYQDWEDDGELVVKYINSYDKKNKVLELNRRDIFSVEDNVLEYDTTNGKTKKAKLSKTVALIYNGKLIEYDDEKVKPQTGTVTLISNDEDDVYDVVSVMSYKNYVVSSVSPERGTIGTKQGVNINLDIEETDTYNILKGKSGDMLLEDIEIGNVISYAESEDSGTIKVNTILVSDSYMRGTIEGIDSHDESLVISGKTYKATAQFIEGAQTRDTGMFYINYFGDIIYSDSETAIVYGYLQKMWLADDVESVFCSIFTENNRWVELKLKSKINLNGRACTADEAFDEIGRDQSEYQQLIRYLVNGQGEITRISTAKEIAMNSAADKEAVEKDEFRLSLSGSYRFHRRDALETFAGVVNIDSNSIIFVIPDDKSDREGYQIYGSAELTHDNTYTIEAYNATSMRTASIFVMSKPKVALNKSTPSDLLIFAGDGGKKVDDDGEIRDVINVYWLGDKYRLPMNLADDSPITSVTSLSKGDIIQCSINKKGVIEYIEKKYSPNDSYRIENSLYSIATFVAGEITDFDIENKGIVVRYGDNSYAAPLLKNTKVYIFDRASNEVVLGSTSDFLIGDKVYLSMNYLICKELFIIR